MTLLNPPAPPQEFVLDEGGHCVFRINDRKGGSIVEKDGLKTSTLYEVPESKLGAFIQWASDVHGQSR
jgi:hypothetical protein